MTHWNITLKKTTLVAVAGALLVQTGCSRFATNDGSLDYQKSYLIKPLSLPEGQPTRSIYPLYDLPEKNEANTLALTNKKGNRYSLPRAYDAPLAQPKANGESTARVEKATEQVASHTPQNPTLQTQSNGITVAKPTTPQTAASLPATATTQPTQVADVKDTGPRKVLSTTEGGIPIIQVEASTNQTRNYLLPALKKAGYTDISAATNSIAFTTSDKNTHLLQYRNLGSVTTIIVTDQAKKLRNAETSAKILTDILTNW